MRHCSRGLERLLAEPVLLRLGRDAGLFLWPPDFQCPCVVVVWEA